MTSVRRTFFICLTFVLAIWLLIRLIRPVEPLEPLEPDSTTTKSDLEEVRFFNKDDIISVSNSSNPVLLKSCLRKSDIKKELKLSWKDQFTN